jgi:hypothetical protein
MQVRRKRACSPAHFTTPAISIRLILLIRLVRAVASDAMPGTWAIRHT